MSVPSNESVPGRYGTIDFVNATSSTGAGIRKVYLIGDGLAGGTGSDGEISEQLNTYADAEDFFGAGSGGAWMASRAMRQKGAAGVPIYGVFMADPAGTASVGQMEITGPATSSGKITIRLGGVSWTTAVDNEDTADEIINKIIAQYGKLRNENTPPWTLTNAAGTDHVVATANNTGAHYGDGAGGYGFGWKVIEATAEGVTATVDQDCLGGSTAGVGVPDPTNCLSTLASVHTHYVVCPVVDPGTDASGSVKIYVEHMSDKGQPPTQMGGVVFAGSKQTLTQQITDHDVIETAIDSARLCYVGIEGARAWEACIAAQACVARAAQTDVSVPNNYEVLSSIDAPDADDKPTVVERRTALNGGVSVAYSPDGYTVQVVRYVSAATDKGADPCLDLMAIETMDEVRDRGVEAWEVQLKNIKVKEAGQKAYTQKCTTPEGITDIVLGVLYEMEKEDKVQGIDDIKDMVSVTLTGTVAAVQVPTPVVNQLAVIDGTFAMYLSLP